MTMTAVLITQGEVLTCWCCARLISDYLHKMRGWRCAKFIWYPSYLLVTYLAIVQSGHVDQWPDLDLGAHEADVAVRLAGVIEDGGGQVHSGTDVEHCLVHQREPVHQHLSGGEKGHVWTFPWGELTPENLCCWKSSWKKISLSVCSLDKRDDKKNWWDGKAFKLVIFMVLVKIPLSCFYLRTSHDVTWHRQVQAVAKYQYKEEAMSRLCRGAKGLK